jgi:hypothetical protein
MWVGSWGSSRTTVPQSSWAGSVLILTIKVLKETRFYRIRGRIIQKNLPGMEGRMLLERGRWRLEPGGC